MIATAVALLSLAVWAYLLFGRGWFWRCAERENSVPVASDAKFSTWPAVVAIIPARDEADMIAHSVGSLLRQDYRGPFSVVVVDDQSADGTAAAALAAAERGRRGRPVANRRRNPASRRAGPENYGRCARAFRRSRRVRRRPSSCCSATPTSPTRPMCSPASSLSLAPGSSVLTSLMVKLRCESAAERWLVPAFVFFFQMLYPFAWVNDPNRRTAAAAGGCMLARSETLAAAGGLEALRGALIDDCALGAIMKRQGPIWLGLTESVHSLRAYRHFADFRRMVARSAFAELRYSPLRLAGAVAGMALVYLAPLLLAIFAQGLAQAAGALAWAMMALALAPTLRLYGRPVAGGLALPAIAAAYIAFTINSAMQYWRGRGGYWKGRIQAPMREAGRV